MFRENPDHISSLIDHYEPEIQAVQINGDAPQRGRSVCA